VQPSGKVPQTEESCEKPGISIRYIFIYKGGEPELSDTTWDNINAKSKKTHPDSVKEKLGHSVRREAHTCSNEP
jgi:hypothetical protein